MRIAFVTAEYPPLVQGGAGHYAQKLTEALASKGHEVVVFTHPECGGLNIPNIKICKVPDKSSSSTIRFWLGLNRAMRTEEEECAFDVVHINGLSYWFFQRLTTAPMILTVHHSVRDATKASNLSLFQRVMKLGSEEGFIMPIVETLAVSKCQYIIAVSKFTKNQIVLHYGVDATKLTFIPDGVDHRNPPSPDDVEAERSSIGATPPIVLFVGRLDDSRKGLDVLLKAFPRVARSTSATLVVVGNGKIDKLKCQMDLASVGDRVIFTGFVTRERLDALYALADLCIVPSRLEGYGFTVVDAMLAGRTVLASRVGALPEVIGVEDELVRPDDPDELSSRMIELLLNANKRVALGRENARLSMRMLSWGEVADATLRVYEESTRIK